MVAFAALTSAILLASSSWTAQAAPSHALDRIEATRIDVRGILCSIPLLKRLCPRGGTPKTVVSTPLGLASSATSIAGARRFPVRYATAKRWQESSMVTTWALPNGAADPASMPLACPQDGADPADISEDCLSMILYVPDNLSTNANTLVWIHGGSFVQGSATAPGLDGSKLAIATSSIVAVIQFRLGGLGFMAPNGPTNLAVKDVINSLKFLQLVLPSFGGSGSRITLAGQSSGATMVRTLLATPSASSLFKAGILASDPMDYGILSPSTKETMQNFFNSMFDCTPTDIACLNALPLENILNATTTLHRNAIYLDGAAGQGEPIRPMVDGQLVTYSLNAPNTFPAATKPLLVTSVRHEAAYTIYWNFDEPMDADYYSMVVGGTFGEPRTDTILASPHYQVASNAPDARPTLEGLGTDYLWKCSAWTFTRNYVSKGGKAYVGQYIVGASYPGNEDVPFCTEANSVCHQDDIQIIFGTVQNPTTAQSALIAEMQKRIKAFMTNGNPNVADLANWQAATSNEIYAKTLGGAGTAAIGACDPAFWGVNPEYDYQFYN